MGAPLNMEPGMTLPSGMGAMTPAVGTGSPPPERNGMMGMVHGQGIPAGGLPPYAIANMEQN